MKNEVGREKLTVISNFVEHSDVVFFYSRKKDLGKVFGAVLDPLLKSGKSQGVYIYPREMDRPKVVEFYSVHKTFHHFPVLDRKYKKLFSDDLKVLEKKLIQFLNKISKKSNITTLIDFEDVISLDNVEDLFNLKRHVDNKFKKSDVNHILAFDLKSQSGPLAEKLIALGSKSIIAENSEFLLLSSFKETGKENVPSIRVLDRSDLEERVKKSLDAVVYSILQNNALCGFDIIKNIMLHFNVFLSQGTVYPLLYDLSEKGYLDVNIKSDNKTRVYSVTKSGKEFFRSKIQGFVEAQNRVTDFIQARAEEI